MLALKEHIAREDLTQSHAAKIFGATQPRISDLMRGRIDLFAIDTPVNTLATAGLRVECTSAAPRRRIHRLRIALRAGDYHGRRQNPDARIHSLP